MNTLRAGGRSVTSEAPRASSSVMGADDDVSAPIAPTTASTGATNSVRPPQGINSPPPADPAPHVRPAIGGRGSGLTAAPDTLAKAFAVPAPTSNAKTSTMSQSSHWTNKNHDGRRMAEFTRVIANILSDSRESLAVGQELAWPSSLTTAQGDTRLTLGVDGSILAKGRGVGGAGEVAVLVPADIREVSDIFEERLRKRADGRSGLSGSERQDDETVVLRVTNKGAVVSSRATAYLTNLDGVVGYPYKV